MRQTSHRNATEIGESRLLFGNAMTSQPRRGASMRFTVSLACSPAYGECPYFPPKYCPACCIAGWLERSRRPHHRVSARPAGGGFAPASPIDVAAHARAAAAAGAEQPRAVVLPADVPANHFTSTSTRIQGWMQHWNRCFPFDRPAISRWLP